MRPFQHLQKMLADKNMSLQEYLEDLRQEGERKSREIKENWKYLRESTENIEKYEDWQDSRISDMTRLEEQEDLAETRTPRKRKFEDIVKEDLGQTNSNLNRQEIQKVQFSIRIPP
jgi:regulator of sigma D